MRGKKVVNNNPIIYVNPLKLQQAKPNTRLKLKDVKSHQSKFINHPNINYNTKKSNIQHINKKIPIVFNQCQILTKNRQNCNYIPINNPFYQSLNKNTQYPINRLLKGNQRDEPMKIRTNNFIQYNQYASHNNSQQKMQVFSAEPNSRATSRSSNNSTKKKGIQLTKTLLKKISGMYTDKDFQNRSSYSNKSNRQETTGIMTSSGKGLYDYDEYQISDFDILLNQKHQNHHLHHIEYNPLSFRDSVELERSKDSLKPLFKKNQMPKSRIIYQHLVKNSFNPPKQLNSVKSHQFLNSKSNTQSIVIGQEPPQNQNLKRRNHNYAQQEQDYEKYLIHSKNKTMDELSVKESMVVGFESYYQ